MAKLESNPVRNVDKPRINRRPKVRYLSAGDDRRLRKAMTDVMLFRMNAARPATAAFTTPERNSVYSTESSRITPRSVVSRGRRVRGVEGFCVWSIN
jgi:hypothetical protein